MFYLLAFCVAGAFAQTAQDCRQKLNVNTRLRHQHDNSILNTGVTVRRNSILVSDSDRCAAHIEYPECTSWYQVKLSLDFTNGDCNDVGMLPPHGINQKTQRCVNMTSGNPWRSEYGNVKDYTKYPYADNSVKQSMAKAKNSVTALTESGANCIEDNNCAFPYGFLQDTIKQHKQVCVEVTAENNVNKAKLPAWIEISASSGLDASYCVFDKDKMSSDPAGGELGCTNTGDLIFHGDTEEKEKMFLGFRTMDNYDDSNIEFHFRISGSYEPFAYDKSGTEGFEMKDSEDWSGQRDGAEFPMALMNPYPIGYEEPVVFGNKTQDSAVVSSPVFMLFVSMMCLVQFLI